MGHGRWEDIPPPRRLSQLYFLPSPPDENVFSSELCQNGSISRTAICGLDTQGFDWCGFMVCLPHMTGHFPAWGDQGLPASWRETGT